MPKINPEKIKYLRQSLDALYNHYNKREFVSPDPLQFLYDYDCPADREIVGFIAASLAFGNVTQILKSINLVLKPLGLSPSSYLKSTSEAELKKSFLFFKHRWFTGADFGRLMVGLKKILKDYGSI